LIHHNTRFALWFNFDVFDPSKRMGSGTHLSRRNIQRNRSRNCHQGNTTAKVRVNNLLNQRNGGEIGLSQCEAHIG
jgi:hypothetical protein